MTPSTGRPRPASEMPVKLTTDDLRHKALAVREVAADEAQKLLKSSATRMVVASAVIFAVALSLAYYAGQRAATSAAAKRR